MYIELRDDLSPAELDALDYLFNDRQERPEQWPAHPFFETGDPPEAMGRQDVFPPGAFVSVSWRASEHPGMFSGVHYACPNLKLEWFYNVHLGMMRWLASISSSRGYVGAFKNQDDDEGLPMLFYVYDRKLYAQQVSRGIQLFSVDGDEEYAWPEA